MRIHEAGERIILWTAVITGVIAIAGWCLVEGLVWLKACVGVALLLEMGFVIRFFRVPSRVLPVGDIHVIYAPADGEVVAVERVFEGECLQKECIQVSIFMSIWNVHINWIPVGGVVEYFAHHHGKFLVAWNPKSSQDNERTTTLINSDSGHRIVVRQIAGFVARRIVNYATVGQRVEQDHQLGFIKFGSRVDVFLPVDSDINVKIGDKCVGTQSVLAHLPR